MYLLNEDNRNQLISKSKSSVKGKQRYDRRNKSKVSSTSKEFNSIDMNKLFKKDILTVDIPVQGETDKYNVKISFGGFLDILKGYLKNKDTYEYRDISRACITGFNKDDVYIHCTCPDFCLHEDTEIKLLNGEVYTIKDICSKFNNGEELWTYSVDDNGDFKPGKITDVWVSGMTDTLVKVTLDNGKEIITTDNHRYMLRDGSFIEAKNLEEKMSLMPLYFSNHNGYEAVKINSISTKTIFKSVYKIVADEVLKDEIEAAKSRSNENIIQIHHADFNKSNNYPSNLFPMGKMEHWEYHYKHLHESGIFDKWQEAGKRYWEMQTSRDKQAEVMRAVMHDYYSSMTTEEISAMRRANGNYSDEWKERISKSTKAAWANYSEDEYKARCYINKVNNNNPVTKEKQSQKRKLYWSVHPERKSICSENIKKAAEAVRGVPFTGAHKNKIRQSLLNRTQEEKQITNEKRKQTMSKKSPEELQVGKLRNRDSKILNILNYMLSHNIELTFENYDACMKLPQYYKKSFPRVSKYFDTIEQAIDYYKLDDRYNHKVQKVELIKLDHEVPVYDLTVDKYNNFYVDAGVILHNCYRYNYHSSRNNTNSGEPETRPSKITNPNDTLGSGCKHILLVLSNTSWILRVARVINNYIHYMEDKYPKMYADLIYPAIFGREYEDSVQLTFDDKDELDTSKDTIDVANDYNKKRTQFQKGNIKGVRFAKDVNKKDDTQINLEEIPNEDDL